MSSPAPADYTALADALAQLLRSAYERHSAGSQQIAADEGSDDATPTAPPKGRKARRAMNEVNAARSQRTTFGESVGAQHPHAS
jgi:hypothetical protein